MANQSISFNKNIALRAGPWQIVTPLVVSGGVCWWRETTTKCLW